MGLCEGWDYCLFSHNGGRLDRWLVVGVYWEIILTNLSAAFFPCPECGRQAKCLEVRKRAADTGTWKYRRYECSAEHKFSTNEHIYQPVRGTKKNLIQFREEIGDAD